MIQVPPIRIKEGMSRGGNSGFYMLIKLLTLAQKSLVTTLYDKI
jgi:hypothetical protein